MLLGVGQTFDDTITDFSFVFLFLFFCLFFHSHRSFQSLDQVGRHFRAFLTSTNERGSITPLLPLLFPSPRLGSTGVVADPFAFKRCFDRRFCLSVAKGRYSTWGVTNIYWQSSCVRQARTGSDDSTFGCKSWKRVG